MVDWDGGFQNYFQFATSDLGAVWEDSGGTHLSYSRGSLNPAYRVSVTTLLHGATELVIADNNAKGECSFLKDAASSSGHGALLTLDNGTRYDVWLGTSSATGSSYDFTLVTSQLGTSPYIQRMAVGSSFLTLEQATASGAVYSSAFRLSDKKIVPSTEPMDIGSERPLPVPGGYVALVAQSPYYLAFMPIEGGYRPLVRALPGNQVTWVGVDVSDQSRLVWQETNLTTDQIILYTSPFANTEAGIVRKAVAVLPSSIGGVVNAGIFVNSGGQSSVSTPKMTRMVRLSDGLGWDVPAEPDTPMVEPLWVNADSVWVFISRVLPGQPGYPDRGGLIRVGRSTLGAPSIPSGI